MGVAAGGSSAIEIDQGSGGITTLNALVRLRGATSELVTNGVSLSNSLIDIGASGNLRLFYGVNSGTQQVFNDSDNSLEIAGAVLLVGGELEAHSIVVDSSGVLRGDGQGTDETLVGAQDESLVSAQVWGPIENNGLISAAQNGSFIVNGSVSGHGFATLSDDATLEFAGSVSAGQQIVFGNTETTGDEVLQIDSTNVGADDGFQATISGFTIGDAIVLLNLSGAIDYSFQGSELTLNFQNGESARLSLAGLNNGAAFQLTATSDGGTQISLAMTAGLAAPLGNVSGVTYTNDDELTGFAPAGASVLIYEGDDLLGTTTVTPEKTWSFEAAGLSAGDHILTVKVLNSGDDLVGSENVDFDVTDAVSVGQFLAGQDISDPQNIDIIDTAANVAANLDALDADADVGEIQLTDATTQVLGLTVAMALSDTVALGKIDEPYLIAISDTAANVALHIDSLAVMPALASITLTDPDTPNLTLTATQAAADGLALDKISNNAFTISIEDSSANVVSNFDALATIPGLTSITLTDVTTPVLVLSVGQMVSGASLLRAISNSNYRISVEDSAANVSGNLNALNANSHVVAITLTDSGALLLTAAEALYDTTALAEIANVGYQIAIVDTAANISAKVPSQEVLELV